MHMIKAIYVLIAIAILAGVLSYITSNNNSEEVVEDEGVMCAMDAMMCPDGTYVGRTGPNCEFVCPDSGRVEKDVSVITEDKTNLIRVNQPVTGSVITSPLQIEGEARGNWFFEASFPVSLVNWDGVIIAEGVAEAQGEWMTEDFVPFKVNLEFTNPYNVGDPDFMKSGTLILRKDNPSGLPEHDDALEIPIRFAQ